MLSKRLMDGRVLFQTCNHKITLPNGELISTIGYFYALKTAKIDSFDKFVYQMCW